LRWLDGEQLCVTRPFFQACNGAPPGWLVSAARSRVLQDRRDDVFWSGRRLLLHRWPAAPLVRRIVARIAGRRVDTMLTRRAGLHFRLRRYGITVPRVLAFGRRPDGSGFLLTCPIAATQPLTEWLATRAASRAAVLMKAGALLAKLHAAGQRLETKFDALVVRDDCLPALTTVDLRPLPRPAGRWPLRDLGLVVRALRLHSIDAARFVRGYLGAGSSASDGRELAEALRGELPAPRGSQHG
jgi:hypothetical protein